MNRFGIALGSNLGDRLANLRSAMAFLRTLHAGSGPFLASRIYETAPVGCAPEDPNFLNAAVELSYTGVPLALLAACREFEIQHGRPPLHETNHPRTIDLDLLYHDQSPFTHPDLILPHPRLHLRHFVLMPLCDICPERVITPGGETLVQILANLGHNDDIKVYVYKL